MRTLSAGLLILFALFATHAARAEAAPVSPDVLDLPAEHTYPTGATLTSMLLASCSIVALSPSGTAIHASWTSGTSAQIPPCLTWWVCPEDELSDDYLAKIAPDLRANDVPGLSLSRWESYGCVVLERKGDISSTGMKVLADLDRLIWLDLRCTSIDDEGLRNLSAMENLRHLDLSYCTNITDAGMAFVAKMRNLKSIRLPTSIGSDGLRALKALPDLRALSYHTDVGVAQIDSLMELNLSGSQISDQGVAAFSKLTQLRRLRLIGSDRFFGSGLATLGGLERLEELEVRHCSKFDQTALKWLESWPRLERLTLAQALTDDGVRHLARARRVRSLTLGPSRITDAAMTQLAGLPLHSLRLISCYGITKAGVETFRQAVPNCEVIVTRAMP